MYLKVNLLDRHLQTRARISDDLVDQSGPNRADLATAAPVIAFADIE
jgi:hypothetical protein